MSAPGGIFYAADYSRPPVFISGSVRQGCDGRMVYGSYKIGRIGRLLWLWEVELDGKPARRGLSLGKPAARWAARCVIRAARRPRPPEAEHLPEEQQRRAA